MLGGEGAMSLAYIRTAYHVPAKRGTHIRFEGVLAVITSANGPHLRVRLLEESKWGPAGHFLKLHPTWHVEYLEADR